MARKQPEITKEFARRVDKDSQRYTTLTPANQIKVRRIKQHTLEIWINKNKEIIPRNTVKQLLVLLKRDTQMVCADGTFRHALIGAVLTAKPASTTITTATTTGPQPTGTLTLRPSTLTNIRNTLRTQACAHLRLTEQLQELKEILLLVDLPDIAELLEALKITVTQSMLNTAGRAPRNSSIIVHNLGPAATPIGPDAATAPDTDPDPDPADHNGRLFPT